MKRLLMILCALTIGVSAHAANEYDAYVNGTVSVIDRTTTHSWGTEYKYEISFNQKGVNSSGTSYPSSVVMIVYPKGPSIAGTYRKDDYTMDNDSYVLYNGAFRYVTDYTGKPTEVTIADNGDGTYTISGAFRTKSGSSYYYYYYYATDSRNTFKPEFVIPDPYEKEPAKGSDITFNAQALDVYDKVSEGNILIDLYDAGSSFIELYVPASVFELPAGTYSVSESGDKGTVKAANGSFTGYYPSYTYLDLLDGWDESIYFITGGSVTVSYSPDFKSVTISGEVVSGHGTNIIFSYTGANPFPHVLVPDNLIQLDVEDVECIIAYDITINDDNTMTIAATVVPSGNLDEFVPSVFVDGIEHVMTYDPLTGEAEFTTSESYSADTDVKIMFALSSSAGYNESAEIHHIVK